MKVFSILFAFALLAGCQRQQPAKTPAELVVEAVSDPGRMAQIEELFVQGQTEQAQREFERYVKEYPRDGLAWASLGRIHSDAKNFAAASAAYDKALAINPRDPIALTGYGILHRRFDNENLALEYYQKALAVDENYAEAHASIATIYLKRHDDALALKHALRGHELDQTNPTIASNLAIAYHFNNDPTNRDKYTRIAKELGYPNIERLGKIYSGELIIRDDK